MPQIPAPIISQAISGSFQTECAHQAKTFQQHKLQLQDQITELAAHIHAASFRLLELIRELDECEGWAGEGIISCAHWLNWKCGMALGVARERVRVAHALKALPKISKVFRKGKISYSKVRAMTRVATPKNEDYLLMIAHYGTASHVERLVRNYRCVKRNEALEKSQKQHLQRELSWFTDDDGCWVVRGRLSPEQGALVQKALEQAMDHQYREQKGVPSGTSDHNTDEIHAQPEPIASRRADAMVRMAENYRSRLKSQSNSEKFLVHVHTDMETLKAEGTGAESEIESGGNVCSETTRRISCDASVVQWLESNDVVPLSIGRKSRTIPPAIRRALARRDSGCRFPGCTHTRFVDAHHIRHWADGGETSIENLVLLCSHHHHLVHEGEFDLLKTSTGELQFTDQNGKVVPTCPAGRSRGNVNDLFKQNKERCIHITPKSAQSHWMGEKMDDQLAVEGLIYRE